MGKTRFRSREAGFNFKADNPAMPQECSRLSNTYALDTNTLRSKREVIHNLLSRFYINTICHALASHLQLAP